MSGSTLGYIVRLNDNLNDQILDSLTVCGLVIEQNVQLLYSKHSINLLSLQILLKVLKLCIAKQLSLVLADSLTTERVLH